MAHVYNKHPEKIPRDQSSPGSTSRSSPGTTKTPEQKSPSPQPDQPVIKTEPQSSAEEEEESRETTDQELVPVKREATTDSEESGNTENIPNETLSSSKRIKEEVQSESSRSPLETSIVNRDLPKSASSSPRSQKSPISRDSTPKTKSENPETVDKKSSLMIPRVDPQMMPYYHVVPAAFHVLPNMVSPVSSQIGQSPKRTDKYCRHCDISFTYKNSYLAHKKYYCSANMSSEEMTSPAQA